MSREFGQSRSALSSLPRRTEIANAIFPSLVERVGEWVLEQALLSASITSSLKERIPVLCQAGSAVCNKLGCSVKKVSN